MFFSIQIQIKKSIEKLIFSAFGQILFSILIRKVLKNCFLAVFGKIFWFWRMFFSIEILIK